MQLQNSVYGVLSELGNTSSRNEKIKIIEQNANNDLLKETFKYALDPFCVYGIRVIPQYTCNNSCTVSLKDFIEYLPNFIERKITGHAALNKLAELLENMPPDEAHVAELIVTKDLRCGVQGSTVNKVWKNFIFSYPCLLGESYHPKLLKKFTWRAIAQLKLDGLRVNAFVNSATGKVTLLTRAGKLIDIHGQLDSHLCLLHASDQPDLGTIMYDGELLVVDRNGNVLPRKAGNGILNKAIRGTITEEEASRVRIQLWDRVPDTEFRAGKSKLQYHERFGQLLAAAQSVAASQAGTAAVLADGTLKFNTVEYRYVDNIDQAIEYYRDALERGQEGIMLKTLSHYWEDKRSKELIKFKSERLCELRVTDWLEGTGQFQGALGKLSCVSECGNLEVNVGSGFSHSFRFNTKPEDIIGKIITVKFNEVIDSEDKPGKYSLFLGRFIEVREDKFVADDLATIQSTSTVE